MRKVLLHLVTAALSAGLCLALVRVGKTASTAVARDEVAPVELLSPTLEASTGERAAYAFRVAQLERRLEQLTGSEAHPPAATPPAPEHTASQARANDLLSAHFEGALARGAWTATDRRHAEELWPQLSGEVRHQLLTRFAMAINEGHLTVDHPHMPFSSVPEPLQAK